MTDSLVFSHGPVNPAAETPTSSLLQNEGAALLSSPVHTNSRKRGGGGVGWRVASGTDPGSLESGPSLTVALPSLAPFFCFTPPNPPIVRIR